MQQTLLAEHNLFPLIKTMMEKTDQFLTIHLENYLQRCQMVHIYLFELTAGATGVFKVMKLECAIPQQAREPVAQSIYNDHCIFMHWIPGLLNRLRQN